jgi:hypothetical protein
MKFAAFEMNTLGNADTTFTRFLRNFGKEPKN